jgi:hypothetical protein
MYFNLQHVYICTSVCTMRQHTHRPVVCNQVEHVHFAENSAPYGGAVISTGVDLVLKHVWGVDNYAAGDGGFLMTGASAGVTNSKAYWVTVQNS